MIKLTQETEFLTPIKAMDILRNIHNMCPYHYLDDIL